MTIPENAAAAGTRGRVLKELFLGTLYTSACTFGGGFVIVTFLKRRFVDSLKWIDEKEMLDITALSQSAPGAVAVNAAILLGWRMAGFPGMLAALLGTIIPPMVILSVVSYFYRAFSSNVYVALALKGMRSGVAAVVLDAAWSLGAGVVKEKSAPHIALMAAAFAATYVFKVNVALVILVSGAAGALFSLLKAKGGKRA